jgi:zinc/manganese transport system permease protein
MNLFETDLSILWPALIAGVLVVISHVPLGQQVFSRGIVFIDLAIAQVAGLGVIIASGFGLPFDGCGAGRGGARGARRRAAAHLDGKKRPRRRRRYRHPVRAGLCNADPLARNDPQRRRQPQGPALRADTLGIEHAARSATAILTRSSLWSGSLAKRDRADRLSTCCSRSSSTASVQMVGVYLVFTSLIVPGGRDVSRGKQAQLAVGYALGFASYVTGLAVSS